MDNEVYYLMSQKQLNRYTVITKLIDGHITTKEASECLGLCERQILRLKKGVQNQGASFLAHKNKGKKPQHAIPDQTAQAIINLKKSDTYKDANFLHFQEMLAEYEQINISYSALYNLLKKSGFESPKKRRRFKPHRTRKRKPQEGLLIQMDATPYDWFGTGEKFSLHGAIDDATGKVVALYLAKNECLQGYFEVMRFILSNFGIPVSIYSDGHTIFKSPLKDKLSIEEQLAGKRVNPTQFGRAMEELGITIITARSPQAKGRVERLWETLQSRLPVEFKRNNIYTLDEANAFLSKYIHKFNKQFAVEPQNTEPAFRPVPSSLCIDHILCIVKQRTFDNGGVFSFYNKHFKIIQPKNLPPLPKSACVDVLISPHFGIKVSYRGAIYDTMPYIKPKKAQDKAPSKERKAWSPPDSHYYKYGHRLVKKIAFTESDQEILMMLEDIFLSKMA
jgi:transposase